MAQRSAQPAPTDEATRVLDSGFWIVLILAAACGILVLVSLLRGLGGSDGSAVAGASPSPSGSPEASVDPASFLASTPTAAPAIDLIDQDGQSFSLASLRGTPVFVFFGYTHCPDVCPATIGNVGEAMAAAGIDSRAVFVSVDPQRDTPTWLKEYVRYLPKGFTALTGTEARIRSTADDWGVRYAKVETGTPDGYSMSHTANVYVIDANGMLRATIPFGNGPEAMTAVLRSVAASTPSAAPSTTPTANPSLSGTPTPAPASSAPASPAASPSASTAVGPDVLGVNVVSTSVWSGPASPIILTLTESGIPLDDPTIAPTVSLVSPAGDVTGSPIQAVAVQPPGVDRVSYVADVAIPTPGFWRLAVTVPTPVGDIGGTAEITALDPGSSAAIGAKAPTAHTPTLTDVGGLAKAVTTDPAPDLRLSQASTTDALAAGKPFVLVVDSSKFRVSPACGRAILMARYLLDRWTDVGFIHLEPYKYSIVTDTPELDGSLVDPPLNDATAAWGIGGDPWGARSMPWVFVVDGNGVVRAKYQGIMGSEDIDVILSLIEAKG